MKSVLYVIAGLWIAYGVLLILYTEKARGFFRRLALTDHVKLLALLPFIVGVILAVGAFFYPDVFLLSFILGVLAIAKGLYLFFAPQPPIRRIFEWWFEKADNSTIRLFGLLTFILGSAMLAYLM